MLPPEFYQAMYWIDGLSNEQMIIYLLATIGALTVVKFLFGLTTR